MRAKFHPYFIRDTVLFCNVENNTNFHFTAKTRFPASFIVIVVVVIVVVAFFFSSGCVRFIPVV